MLRSFLGTLVVVACLLGIYVVRGVLTHRRDNGLAGVYLIGESPGGGYSTNLVARYQLDLREDGSYDLRYPEHNRSGSWSSSGRRVYLDRPYGRQTGHRPPMLEVEGETLTFVSPPDLKGTLLTKSPLLSGEAWQDEKKRMSEERVAASQSQLENMDGFVTPDGNSRRPVDPEQALRNARNPESGFPPESRSPVPDMSIH